MYEYLKPYIAEKYDMPVTGDAVFYQVAHTEIELAEQRIGTKFPSDLVLFWQEIGFGFFVSDDSNLINRIMHPDDIASFMCREYPYQNINSELYPESQFVMMHCDSNCFMKLSPDGSVVFLNFEVAKSFKEFIAKMSEDPTFYWNIDLRF